MDSNLDKKQAFDLTGLDMARQFDEIVEIILSHRSRASRAVNNELLMTAWQVGCYVSTKLKSEEWNSEFVQPKTGQLMKSSQISTDESSVIVQPKTAQFVQPTVGQLPKILELTTLTNHIEILCRCKTSEERMFYILYANKERLVKRELQRCISNQTFSTLLGGKKSMSKGMLETYPSAPVMFKDTLFIDFLNLPKKHSEKKLKDGLLEHMKQFILELGKDFIFMDQEYRLEVGSSTFKADLLFFHRGIQALVAVELKKSKFDPRDLGQLEFYLEALDRDVKRSNENPSVGIILCPEADRVVVEYAMSRSMSPTMIAQYKRILIPQKRMQAQLNEFCNQFLTND